MQSPPFKFCPSCGQKLAAHMQQCGRCKSFQPAQPPQAGQPAYKICPNCGQRLALSMTHCGQCYAAQPLPTASMPPQQAAAPSGMPFQSTLSPEDSKALGTRILYGCAVLIPLFFFLFSVLWQGVQSPSASSLKSKLHLGMSVSEVEDIIGNPARSQDMDGIGMRLQMLYYNSSDGMVQIAFTNGRLTSFNQY